MCYMKHEPSNKNATAKVRTIAKKSVLNAAKTAKQNKVVVRPQTVKPKIEKTASNKSVQTVKPGTKKSEPVISVTEAKVKAAKTVKSLIQNPKVSVKSAAEKSKQVKIAQNIKAETKNSKLIISVSSIKSKIKKANSVVLDETLKPKPKKLKPVVSAQESKTFENKERFLPFIDLGQSETKKNKSIVSNGKVETKIGKTKSNISSEKNKVKTPVERKIKVPKIKISAPVRKIEIVENKTEPKNLSVVQKPVRKKVKPISSAVFRGKKDRYDFKVFPLNEMFEAIPAVYIISKRTTDKFKRGHHALICIGETDSISDEIKKHKKGKCVKKHNANVISILPEANEKMRLKIETDLKAAHTIACNLE
ncbi:MAG: hypothetical protein ACR2MG_20020 [Pyrinomonadaceae bacterium]